LAITAGTSSAVAQSVPITPGTSSAVAQSVRPDWVVGQWNATETVPQYSFPPSRYTVNFVKNGNEIRGVFGNTYLLRAVTDNFGVTTWQTWVAGGPTCPNTPGNWVTANMQVASDQRAITLYRQMRDGGSCQVSLNYSVVNLTR
jgi:hypothetical protein